VDISQVLTWPQALVAVVIVLAGVVWPSIASWMNSRAARAATEDARHQVDPNSGRSMVDGVNRTEAGVVEIKNLLVQHIEDAERRDAERDARIAALAARPKGLFRRL
jgi:hypothetical protein